jgi:site-specific recombinase XerD
VSGGVSPGRAVGQQAPGRRALPVCVAQLRTRRRWQNAERLAADAAWEDWDLVFCSPTGAPLDPHDDWEDWHALLTAAGVREARMTPRHTAGTLLLEQGIDIRVVQQILEHSQLSQTRGYTPVSLELTPARRRPD